MSPNLGLLRVLSEEGVAAELAFTLLQLTKSQLLTSSY